MSSFSNRLREEIEFSGLTRKELAYHADVKPRALDMYLGTQNSMPPADVAVRLAKVLNVSVEYLITGEKSETPPIPQENSVIEKDLKRLPKNIADSIVDMIHNLAKRELEFQAR